MKKAILGTKVGMTQIFGTNGEVIPVTVVKAGPCSVVQVKTIENDGYNAVKVGYGDIRETLVNKPVKGQFEKAGLPVKRFLKELKLDNSTDYEVGKEITVDIFEDGDSVDVTGTSKGKGFQGSIKRWGQSRGPMTHGSHYHRGPGSMGGSSSPSKVAKGKRLPGHMGSDTITVQNLKLVKIDSERNLLLIKGAIPGPKGNLLKIQETVKSNKG